MLVRIIDLKGRVRFINAAYVKALFPKGEFQTSIVVSGWSNRVHVDSPPQSVADLFNAAMPIPTEAALADLEQQQAAAASAAF